jgi:uncharacterized protein (DUF1919 family)
MLWGLHIISDRQHFAEEVMSNKLADKMIFKIEELRLKNKRFILLSNNCWGYEIYRALGRPYNTPFIGLFLFPECYVRFLENFEQCINSRIKFTKTSKHMKGCTSLAYPIGLINNDIEIHFLHYSSEREVLEKWGRRVDRLKRDLASNVPSFVKFCNRDGCTKEHLSRFHALPFENKLSIGVNPFSSVNHLYQPNMKDAQGAFVLDGLNLYRKRYHYFDITCWLSSGGVRHSTMSRVLSLIS